MYCPISGGSCSNVNSHSCGTTATDGTITQIIAANSGDTEALLAVHSQFAHQLNRIAQAITRDSDDAHDVVIDVLIKICELPEQRLPISNGAAWLRRLTHNLSVDFLRKYHRRILTDRIDQFDMHTEGVDPAEIVCLHSLLLNLAPVPRRIVIEKIVLDRTHQEIAECLGLPSSSVRREYRTALRDLRKMLTR